jgi:hypothetical protein
MVADDYPGWFQLYVFPFIILLFALGIIGLIIFLIVMLFR